MAQGERGSSKPFKRGSIWWIRYSVPDEGQRKESSKSKDKRDALRLLHERLKQIDDRTLVAGRPTIGQLLQLYLADQRRMKRHSYCQAEGYVRLHLRPAFGTCQIDAFTSDLLNRFIEKKEKDGYSAASINQFLAALRRAFRLGSEERPPLVHVLPVIRLLPVDNARSGLLDRAGYVAMRDALPPHQQMLLVIGYHLGLRRGEMLKLRWNPVDFDRGTITLDRSQTKGNQDRTAPLYGDLRAWLKMAHATRDGEALVSFRGHPMVETKTAWETARKKAGVPELLIHDLRRTAMRNMVRAGIPDKQAMLISGHRTRAIFDRYNIIDDRDVQAAGAKLEAYMEAEREKEENRLLDRLSPEVRTADGKGVGPNAPKVFLLQ